MLLAGMLLSASVGLGASVAFQKGGNMPPTVGVTKRLPSTTPPPVAATPTLPPAAPAKPQAPAAKPAPVRPATPAPATPKSSAGSKGGGSSGGSAPTVPAPVPHRPIGGGQSGPTPPFADGVSPIGVSLFDPNGDGTSDHKDAVGKAIDGDPATDWTTANYPNGLTKPGVGLTLDAGANIAYSRLGILTRTPGIDIEVYGSADSSPPTTLPAQGWTLLARQSNLPSKSRVALDVSKVQPRYYLIWITHLPAGKGHAGISEASLIR
ncbi:MAG: hypothetical protein NVS2B6_02430 [Thermoleophilaceae bacterium]